MENPIGGVMFGALAIGVGYYFLKQGKEMDKHGIRTTGTIIGNKENDDLSYPIIEFVNQNNEKVTATLSTGYRPAKSIGTVKNIVYYPENPNEIISDSNFLYKTLPIVLFALGGIAAIYNIYNLLS